MIHGRRIKQKKKRLQKGRLVSALREDGAVTSRAHRGPLGTVNILFLGLIGDDTDLHFILVC